MNKHWPKLSEDKVHPKADDGTGCIHKHETKHEKSATYPACAYKYNGYEETYNTPAKRALYEIDLDHRARHWVRTGLKQRQSIRDRLMGVIFQEKVKRGRVSEGGQDKHRPDNPLNEQGAWDFKDVNYKDELRPFKHEYHHIMPTETVFEKLDADQLSILRDEVKYNINSKLNMIILPCTEDVARVLALPRHSGRHGKNTPYAISCSTEINKYKGKLSKLQATDCEETKKTAAGHIKQSLEQWQQRTFWELVRFGRTSAREGKVVHINRLPRVAPPG